MHPNISEYIWISIFMCLLAFLQPRPPISCCSLLSLEISLNIRWEIHARAHTCIYCRCTQCIVCLQCIGGKLHQLQPQQSEESLLFMILQEELLAGYYTLIHSVTPSDEVFLEIWCVLRKIYEWFPNRWHRLGTGCIFSISPDFKQGKLCLKMEKYSVKPSW